MNDNLRYITFHNDPGHGWLEVSVEEAREAERVTGEKISPYSYISRGIAFLEEDCDAGIFLRYLDKLTTVLQSATIILTVNNHGISINIYTAWI
jgi:hypothetical protein